MEIAQLRAEYHRRVSNELIRIQLDSHGYFPNFADKSSRASRAIALDVVKQLGIALKPSQISSQTVGAKFETITRDFLRKAFQALSHLRPGEWIYDFQRPITDFDQYLHLASLEVFIREHKELKTTFGIDYIIKPDIIIARMPVSDEEINTTTRLIDSHANLATLTPFRKSNCKIPEPILHASISCKWTLRSDRAQNARTEALNLIRNRKGNVPHIVAVTAEPLPTRIASLALGTGDIDCVYHFALSEIESAIKGIENEDQLEMLRTLIDGRRLRDISDLPFDLIV